MCRVLFPRLVWPTLGAMLLKTSVVLLLTTSLPLQSLEAVTLFTPAYLGLRKMVVEEASGISQELSRQWVQQSQQTLAAAGPCAGLPPWQQGGDRHRSVPAPIPLSILASLPRKLPPPSAEDTPFLS
jgi:hypothetical protein